MREGIIYMQTKMIISREKDSFWLYNQITQHLVD